LESGSSDAAFRCHYCSNLLVLLLGLVLLLLQPFNRLFSRTTSVSCYHKGKTSLDLNEARDDGVFGCSGVSWTICKQSACCSGQTTTSTPHQSIFTGRMLFLTPIQQCQSTEGIYYYYTITWKIAAKERCVYVLSLFQNLY